jgi:glyoxylase-like metal-dependent hydrolase (beta-lactamase superfamily II)
LKLIGLKPEDIDFVVFTHVHLDHAGQAHLFRDLKTPLVAHRKELMHAVYMLWLGKIGAYVPQDLDALRGAQWHTFDGEYFELLPGIELIHVGGHTPGSTMVRVTTDAGNTYIFTGDLIHLPEELEVESKGWLLGNASEYQTGLRVLKLMLRRPNTNLVISHDPTLWEKYPRAPEQMV